MFISKTIRTFLPGLHIGILPIGIGSIIGGGLSLLGASKSRDAQRAAAEAAKFDPWGVQTGLGGAYFDPKTKQVSTSLSPYYQALLGQMQGQIPGAFGGLDPRIAGPQAAPRTFDPSAYQPQAPAAAPAAPTLPSAGGLVFGSPEYQRQERRFQNDEMSGREEAEWAQQKADMFAGQQDPAKAAVSSTLQASAQPQAPRPQGGLFSRGAPAGDNVYTTQPVHPQMGDAGVIRGAGQPGQPPGMSGGLAGQALDIGGGAFGALGTFDPQAAAQQRYGAIEELMAPGRQRARQSLESRLFSQGRLGGTGGALEQLFSSLIPTCIGG